ncbi:hypothetical protein TO66_27780 [Pseudomonas sp. MRSN 12121]|nr:hypothetical protein TO66_27780 [Pseudomonas sp. MRSN 12121]
MRGLPTSIPAKVLLQACSGPINIRPFYANRGEMLRLVEAADRLQVLRLMLCQPVNPLTGLSATDLLALADAQPLSAGRRP